MNVVDLRQHALERSFPVFVLGSVRSGTSAVCLALREGAGIVGHDEGHVTTLLQSTFNVADVVSGNVAAAQGDYLLREFDVAAFKRHCSEFVTLFLDTRYPEGLWIDKSPDDGLGCPAIRSAAHFAKLYPNARFLFCLRRGIENVLSRERKFPQTSFYHHCRNWAQAVMTWRDVREQLGGRWLEIRQDLLALNPERIANEIGQFLQLGQEQISGMCSILKCTRPEQSQPVGEGDEIGLDETGWDEPRKEIFRSECSEAMTLAGYSMEGASSATPRLALFAPVTCADRDLAGRFLRLDANTFVFGPPQPPRISRHTYCNLLIRTRRRFSARVLVEGPTSLELRCGIQVHNLSQTLLAEAAVVASPGQEPVPMAVELPAWHEGPVNVTITSQVVKGEYSAAARAVWQEPAFHH